MSRFLWALLWLKPLLLACSCYEPLHWLLFLRKPLLLTCSCYEPLHWLLFLRKPLLLTCSCYEPLHWLLFLRKPLLLTCSCYEPLALVLVLSSCSGYCLCFYEPLLLAHLDLANPSFQLCDALAEPLLWLMCNFGNFLAPANGPCSLNSCPESHTPLEWKGGTNRREASRKNLPRPDDSPPSLPLFSAPDDSPPPKAFCRLLVTRSTMA